MSKEKQILVVVIIVQHYSLQMYLKSPKFLGKNLQKKLKGLMNHQSFGIQILQEKRFLILNVEQGLIMLEMNKAFELICLKYAFVFFPICSHSVNVEV